VLARQVKEWCASDSMTGACAVGAMECAAASW
jgi:hypothetical protein